MKAELWTAAKTIGWALLGVGTIISFGVALGVVS